MRFLLLAGTITVALLGYTGLWFFTAQKFEQGIEHWAASERANGAIVNYESLKITGFPYRMRAELTDLAIARPGPQGMSMVGTRTLVIDSYPHKINHLIFDFPEPVHYDRPLGDKPHNRTWREQTEFSFDKAHASLVLTLEGARASFEATGVSAKARFTEEGGTPGGYEPLMRADTITAHLRPAAEREGVMEGFAEAKALVLERPDRGTGKAPPPLDQFQSRFFITQSQLLVRAAQQGKALEPTLKDWRDQGGTLEIERVFARLDKLQLTADGTLKLDEAGYPRGPLKFKADGWRDSALLLNPDGTRTRQQQEMAAGMFELFDQLDGNLDGAMQTQLQLQKGGAWLGPFRLMELEKVW